MNDTSNAKTIAIAITAILGAAGAGIYVGQVKMFFGARSIACEVKSPCPTNVQKVQFVLQAIPQAREVSAKTGVPVSAIVAQASLETGFGTSFLWRNHKNAFGIKCHGAKSCVSRYDTEYLNGKKTGWVSQFRSYRTGEQSFYDYAVFLKQNRRYRDAFSYRKDGKAFVQRVAKAGYATDPNYYRKLWHIMDVLKLNQFDLKPREWHLQPAFCFPNDIKEGYCVQKK